MAATGNPIGAKEAYEIGLVDRLIEGDLRAARRRLRRGGAATSGRSPRPASATRSSPRRAPIPACSTNSARPMPASSAASTRPNTISGRSRRRSPSPMPRACQDERRLFMELMSGTQARAQQYFFFAERKAAKIDGLPEDTQPRDDQAGRRDRRRHDGRRHLDELPVGRHPGHDRRDGSRTRSTAAPA